MEINHKPVKSLDELKAVYDDAVENINRKSNALFMIQRNGSIYYVALDFSRDTNKK